MRDVEHYRQLDTGAVRRRANGQPLVGDLCDAVDAYRSEALTLATRLAAVSAAWRVLDRETLDRLLLAEADAEAA